MGLSRIALRPSRAPFHRIVLGAAATPVGQITILVTFKTQENFRTEYMQFEVADFEMAYNTFLGWATLTKFMAIPHYAYLVLKMPGPNNVITIKGDIKRVYDCDRESCNTADRIITSVELQDLKKALAESPEPDHARGQDVQDFQLAGGVTQQNDPVILKRALQGRSCVE
jgi:hypothetical protein